MTKINDPILKHRMMIWASEHEDESLPGLLIGLAEFMESNAIHQQVASIDVTYDETGIILKVNFHHDRHIPFGER